MKLGLKISLFTFTLLAMSSCGGWTEKDEKNFIESCENMKYERAQCDCFLEKSKSKFNSFEEIKEDQVAFGEIILDADCLSKGDNKQPDGE